MGNNSFHNICKPTKIGQWIPSLYCFCNLYFIHEKVHYQLLETVSRSPRATGLWVQQTVDERTIHLLQGIGYYIQLVKDGYNATLVKNFHVFSNLVSLFLVTVGCFYVHYSTDCHDTDVNKVNFPAYKYPILHVDT